MPEGPALVVDIGHELVPALASLVGHVDVVGLEVEQIEGSGGQSVKWVHVLLGGVLGLRLGGSLLLLGLGLLLRLEDGLETLLGHADLAEDGDELGEGRDAGEPGASLGGSLGEALVENELEGEGEAGGEDDISDGHAAANEVVTGQGLVDGAEVLLDGLAGIVEGGLGHLGASTEDGHDGGVASLGGARLQPVEPLVDLGALNGAGAEEGGAARSEELGDSLGLLELTLGADEKRELVGGVELLVALFGASLIRVDDDLEGLAGELGDDLAGLNQDVSWELSVQFHFE
mmetsp:Transcript_26365/g.32906  ORF Transcript_26365/g.32906 Transcript_26365/m.32906 type:complete len:289 (-) Transcript_26365:17-883(-)